MDSQATGSGKKKDDTYMTLEIRTKIEGRGKGIATHIQNIAELAEDLDRPAPHLAMYMAYDLQVLPRYDYTTGTFKLQGSHDTTKLSRIVDEFIKKFIECYRCRYPKTKLVITESRKIHLECASCDFISEVDMMERLSDFIIRSHLKPKRECKVEEPERILETEI